MCFSVGICNFYLQLHVHKQIRNDINSQATLLHVQLRCVCTENNLARPISDSFCCGVHQAISPRKAGTHNQRIEHACHSKKIKTIALRVPNLDLKLFYLALVPRPDSHAGRRGSGQTPIRVLCCTLSSGFTLGPKVKPQGFNHGQIALLQEHNAPITVMPHPPRLVVGGDFEEGLTQQRALCEGHLPYILFFYCTFARV